MDGGPTIFFGYFWYDLKKLREKINIILVFHDWNILLSKQSAIPTYFDKL
jgi:hypothetical protein